VLINGDCFIELSKLKGNSVDCVIIDPPFNITDTAFDKEIIDLSLLWKELERVVKANTAICIFAAQPFTSKVVMSNPKAFAYEWIWDKHIPRGFANAKRRPLTKHESILVFCLEGRDPRYFPIMRERERPIKYRNYSKRKDTSYSINNRSDDSIRISTHINPNSIIEGLWEANKGKLHPNSKPIALMEYLIKTYTREGETVLDCFCGAAPTGVAALNLNREFIGIEKDLNYFKIAEERLKNADK
jgi:site-specific DNA-methyltransferase (adenine-specific)